MAVYRFHCPDCGDTWDHPEPCTPRETCIDCGGKLHVERLEVG